MKACTTCSEVKPLSSFHNKASTKDKLSFQCKDCVRISNSKWKVLNLDKVYSATAKWRRKNLRIVAALKKRHRAKNIAAALKLEAGRRSRYTSAHPGANAAYSRQWARDNAAHVNEYCAARKARKRNACPRWADKSAIKELYVLAQARSRNTGFQWDVDHIVPLTSHIVSGLHVPDNLRVIPARMNIIKGNRHWPDMPEALNG